MNYHLARTNQQLGVFAKEDILKGLTDGTYLPSDLAWTDGMAEWKPLGTLAEFTTQIAPLAIEPVETTVASPRRDDSSMRVGGGGAVPAGQPVFEHVSIGVMPTPGTAIASLVLGIVSLVTCYFGILFAIPGVICGHMALKSIRLSGNRLQGRGLAMAGLVMGYLWLGLCFLIVVFMVVAGTIAALSGGG